MIPFKPGLSYRAVHLSLCTFVIGGEICAPLCLLSCYERLASTISLCLAIYLPCSYPPFGREETAFLPQPEHKQTKS